MPVTTRSRAKADSVPAKDEEEEMMVEEDEMGEEEALAEGEEDEAVEEGEGDEEMVDATDQHEGEEEEAAEDLAEGEEEEADETEQAEEEGEQEEEQEQTEGQPAQKRRRVSGVVSTPASVTSAPAPSSVAQPAPTAAASASATAAATAAAAAAAAAGSLAPKEEDLTSAAAELALVPNSSSAAGAAAAAAAAGAGAAVVQAPKSRLMIRRIVLENFKSYGGTKIIGPFHKSFSSIVGPNGSGKSNTIDALLFVFGKRAKKMRLNKVSELIHQSGALPNCGSAKVSVDFQDILDTGAGPEDYEVVKDSLLTVSREAFKNNQSKYYLDGKPSNFTEVTALLRKRGVDLEHNRFLILQGEVEQISLMKPKALTPHEDGLLEYLEDIIGSNRLVDPIAEVEGVVEKLTETRQEKLNRLRVAEREKESLDGPRKEAEAWVKAEAERLELQAMLSQAETKKSQSQLAGLEKDHQKLQGHMEEHRKKMEKYEKQVKAIEGEHNTHLSEYQKTQAEMQKLSQQFKDFEQLDVKYNEDIAFQEQKVEKMQKHSQSEKERAQQLLQESEKLKSEAPERENELQCLEKEQVAAGQKVEKIYASLKGKAERLRPQKEKKEQELVPLQQKLSEVQKVVSVAQTEARYLREKTTQVQEQIEDLKKAKDDCSSRIASIESEGRAAAQAKNERVQLTAEAKDRLKQIDAEMEQLSQHVQRARAKAQEANSQMEEEKTRGRLIKAVYEESRAGRLKGVHGRLGDLGTSQRSTNVAVSTACSMLDAIVVDSTEDAQAVIQFIRKNELGRTTCISLEKIREREREMNTPIETPEGVPRLIDLIKPAQPQYAVAFFFAVQHTLVAKDLTQATRIGVQGKRRWRVVTLEGGLIDASGTMSGGGNQVQKGGMRASLCFFSPDEVQALHAEYEKANKLLNEARSEKTQLSDALRLAEKEVGELQLKDQKASMEVASIHKQMEAYESRLKTLKVPQLNAQEKSKLKELEKLIHSREDELNEIQSKHHTVEEQVKELHNQIMNIGGEELKTAKAEHAEITKQCDEARKQVKKALLDADSMVKQSKQAEQAAKKALQDKAEAEKQLATLKEEHSKLDDKAEAILNQHTELEKVLNEKNEILNTLRTKRDEVIEAAQALKNSEVDLVNEIEEKLASLKKLYGAISAWSAKLEEARKEHAALPLDLIEDLRDREGDAALALAAVERELSEEELAEVVAEDVDARMLALENEVKNLKPNLTSIEEFRKADSEHKLRYGEYEDINNQREDARKKLDGLRQQRLEEFMDGFSVISMKLKEMYQMITLGGDAELELVDTLDPFSEGINFSVRPPKKSWKQITNLSGGEKTLASLSLVFALHHYKPTPLYFMDEIDAALDFRNVSIIANYIKERTKDAQFIVISLRNHMFELADLLVGIYKTQDISKSVAIDPTAFEVAAAPAQRNGGGVVRSITAGN
uniref:Structural maintenance of chromosomes protein n=1 Tax=Crypthecodinium cohnii TaxID=2866 RepID=A0A075C407_CRYCO|nr:structure maintenance of chromosomes 4 [Crypthecodinium cohnii]